MIAASVCREGRRGAERRRALGLAVAAPEPVPVAVVEKVPTSRVRAMRPRLPKAVEPVVVDVPVALCSAACRRFNACPVRRGPGPARRRSGAHSTHCRCALQPAPPRPKPKAAARADAADDDAPKRAATTTRRTCAGAESIVGLRDLAPKDHPTFSDLKGDPEWSLR